MLFEKHNRPAAPTPRCPSVYPLPLDMCQELYFGMKRYLMVSASSTALVAGAPLMGIQPCAPAYDSERFVQRRSRACIIFACVPVRVKSWIGWRVANCSTPLGTVTAATPNLTGYKPPFKTPVGQVTKTERGGAHQKIHHQCDLLRLATAGQCA